MKTYLFKTIFGCGALLLLAGCGGHSDVGIRLYMEPSRVTLAPRQTQEFTVSFSSINSRWEVVEGDKGGTLDILTETLPDGQPIIAGARYTAPAASGTYHVRCTDTDAIRSVSKTATVVVKP